MLARAMPQILQDFRPECLLVELPEDLQDWVPYLAHPDTRAPVAISAVDPQGGLFLYPLADFSPEWVAIRWAFENGVPVKACDLSIASKGQAVESNAAENAVPTALDRLLQQTGDADTGELWQRLVESPGCDAAAENLRAAALTFGWLVRQSTPNVSSYDVLRESVMRQAIREAPDHSVAVVGSFHAPALTPEEVHNNREPDAQRLAGLRSEQSNSTTKSQTDREMGVSLIAYSFEQLDERSGYPAGIRDPVWHQRMVEAKDHDAMDAAALEFATSICRRLRQAGHVAGTPDATETIRMMRDLARMRNLASAGRGEFVEAIQSCLVQGDLMGRGRAVASAAADVLIGDCRGQVTSTAPRCGLAVHIDKLFKELNLPGPESLTTSKTAKDPKEIKLDVLRKPRDRARAVVLRRLCAASIPYATRVDTVETELRENLIERWQVQWQQGTAATIESQSRLGVTLPQVVESIVRLAGQSDGEASGDLPTTILRRLRIATQCGLVRLAGQSLAEIDGHFRSVASLSELVGAITIVARVAAGHFPGLPTRPEDTYPAVVAVFHPPHSLASVNELLCTCLDRLDGLEGSRDPSDVQAIVDLVDWFGSDLAVNLAEAEKTVEASGQPASDTSSLSVANQQARLVHWCRLTLERGSDRMRGAAAGVLCQLNAWPSSKFTSLTEGWLDAAVHRDGRTRLTAAISGATQVMLPLMQSDSVWLSGLGRGIAIRQDADFLKRLPSLRAAFHSFSPADRRRLLDCQLATITERGSQLNAVVDEDGEANADVITQLRQADLAGREAVLAVFPEITKSLKELHNAPSTNPASDKTASVKFESKGDLSLADRWRLVFGLPPDDPPPVYSGCASSLDQLYGRGRGEGSRGGLGKRGAGGGTGQPTPSTTEWAEDLEALFGSDVCEEVLGEAAASGNVAALTMLDPDTVTPSIDLLQQVLSLAGAMPESKTERLRRLAKRITDALAEELAVRLRPATNGLSTPRPTRRRSRRLNLPRTIRENLSNAYRMPDGRASIIAERLIFNAPARREMDWHLTFVVDVSGSMDASVVYSALVAAILDGLPALSVRFLAFSTEVIDFSDEVADPLSLLLEVQVGGGTDIGLGLRAARAGITVPSRSLVVLVSDFEEGVSVGGMLSEVRALVDAGVKCVGLAALDDSGTARYHQGYAQMVAAAGMPVAAVSPERLARWVGDQVKQSGGAGAHATLSGASR